MEVIRSKKGYKLRRGEEITLEFGYDCWFTLDEVALTPLVAVERAIDLNFMLWNTYKKELDRLDKERKTLRVFILRMKEENNETA